MTVTDYISQMGGLLGLGLGFSLVSAIEIIYWITIRLFRNISAAHKAQGKRGTPTNKKVNRFSALHSVKAE